MTPTLPKEDLPPGELFEARRELLDSADGKEKERFAGWREGHKEFRQESGGDDELLNDEIQNRIGFPTAKKVMREIMLADTAKRLPEVLASLRSEKQRCENEARQLRNRQKFNDPKELKLVVSEILWHVEQRIVSYLDGDLESSMKFPAMLQTLEDEIEAEEESDWSTRELNHCTESGDNWRDRIASLEGNYSEEVQADKKFLGGKQVQRAIQFFRAVMIEALPDPFQLRDKVANVTGYLGGGLNRENWERAMVQITRVRVKDVSHPGINYLIKHVGSLFRRLFSLALDDIKKGEKFSSTFNLIPPQVEKHLVCEFDNLLWDLMKSASDHTHCSLEPMHSTVDPSLPTFHPMKLDGDDEERFVLDTRTNKHVKLPTGQEKYEKNWMESTKRRMSTFLLTSGEKAKEFLRHEAVSRATSKTGFLPDERTSMVTDEETEKILRRAFEYIVALMEFNLVNLKFQLNHYLYEGFKIELGRSFKSKLINEADWDQLVEPDPSVTLQLKEFDEKIAGLTDSLQEVQRMQRKM